MGGPHDLHDVHNTHIDFGREERQGVTDNLIFAGIIVMVQYHAGMSLMACFSDGKVMY